MMKSLVTKATLSPLPVNGKAIPVAEVDIYVLLEDTMQEPGEQWVKLSLEENGEPIALMSVEGFRSATAFEWWKMPFAFGSPDVPNLYTISAENFEAMCVELELIGN